MKIRPKSPNELRSQVLEFADGKIGSDEYSRREIVAMAPRDMGGQALHDLQDNPLYDEYAHFLRTKRHTEAQQNIETRTSLQEAYVEFEEEVQKIKDGLGLAPWYERARVDASLIGAGSQAKVYGFSHGGGEYVARMAKYEEHSDSRWVDKYVRGSARVTGVPHFEQCRAVSYEDGVVVSERMSGETLDKLTADDIGEITEDQVHQLLDTIAIAHDRQVKIDHHVSNYMYDKEAGFGLIDLEYESSGYARRYNNELCLVVDVLASLGDDMYQDASGAKGNEQYYAKRARLLEARLHVLETLEQVVRDRELVDDERTDMMYTIENSTHRMMQEYRRVSDPEYVRAAVAEQKSLTMPEVVAELSGDHSREVTIPPLPQEPAPPVVPPKPPEGLML